MLVFRSLALGLLGACFCLLVVRSPVEVRVRQLPAPPPVQLPPAAATIIDVAAGVSAAQLSGLVHLTPGEHVVAIDDAPVTSDLDAGTRIAMRAAGAGSFFDLDVRGPAGPRRVLVLLH